MWRGDLPKAGMEGNVPGSSKNWDGGKCPRIFQTFPGVMGVEGRSSKSWNGGKCPRSDGVEGRSSKAGVEGKVPLVVTFIITDSMQIGFEVIRYPMNQELLIIN